MIERSSLLFDRHSQQTNSRVRLLVSVRSAAEAAVALDAGVDVIDVKEPLRGALGRADFDVAGRVVDVVGGRVPVSMAAGELLETAVDDQALWQMPRGVGFVKFGLAGCAPTGDWPERWHRACAQLDATVAPVAVVYADWRACQAPAPQAVLSQALAAGCPSLLVDTCDKSSGDLFDHWPESDVARFVRQAQAAGLAVVLAGSLREARLLMAAALLPDLVAVRGAACRGGRSTSLCGQRIHAILEDLAASLDDVKRHREVDD